MIHACVVHQSSNTERTALVEELERKIPGLERVEAIMRPNGVQGCSLSQKSIIQRAQDEHWPAVWILEDDCVFTKHFVLDQWLQTVEAGFAAGYDIIVGGTANGQTPAKSHVPHLVPVQGFSSCHCWVLRASGYALALGVDINVPIDIAMSRLALRKACRVPLVARQQPSMSSIQHIFEDYTILFDQAERHLLRFLR